MMANTLEFYVDLWNNFYKSYVLQDVIINYIDMKSYVKSFYMISGTIDVAMDVESSEFHKLYLKVEHHYMGAPSDRATESEAVINVEQA